MMTWSWQSKSQRYRRDQWRHFLCPKSDIWKQVYEVNFNANHAGLPSYSCPDWKNNHLPCKHFFLLFLRKMLPGGGIHCQWTTRIIHLSTWTLAISAIPVIFQCRWRIMQNRWTMLTVLQIPVCSFNWQASQPLREEMILSSLSVG